MTARNTTINTRTKPRIWNLLGERVRRNFLFQAAAGQIPGVSTFHVFGYDSDLTNSLKLIYRESDEYVYPSNAYIVNVISNTSWDDYGDIGANTVRIVGLDYKGNIQTEDIRLKQFTSMPSLGNYSRILTAYVLNSGRLRGAVGSIGLTYSDGTLIGNIYPQFNILTNGNFTVPANADAYIHRYGFSMGAPKETLIGLRVKSPDLEKPNWIMLDFSYVYGGSKDAEVDPPFLLTERTDIELVAQTTADSNTHISAYMDLVLIDKDYDWDYPLREGERGGLEKLNG